MKALEEMKMEEIENFIIDLADYVIEVKKMRRENEKATRKIYRWFSSNKLEKYSRFFKNIGGLKYVTYRRYL